MVINRNSLNGSDLLHYHATGEVRNLNSLSGVDLIKYQCQPISYRIPSPLEAEPLNIGGSTPDSDDLLTRLRKNKL